MCYTCTLYVLNRRSLLSLNTDNRKCFCWGFIQLHLKKRCTLQAPSAPPHPTHTHIEVMMICRWWFKVCAFAILHTGASSGIGAETALQFAESGCGGLALVGRNRENLDAVCQQCQDKGIPKDKVCAGNMPGAWTGLCLIQDALNVIDSRNKELYYTYWDVFSSVTYAS